MAHNIRKALIPVAGLGTRSLPFSKCIPKEMLPVLDTPTIQFIVEECVRAGIEQIVLVTSGEKSALVDHFKPNPHLEKWLVTRGKLALADKMARLAPLCEIVPVRQEQPLGLGHAIYCGRNAIGNEPFAVCLGDEIFPNWDGSGPSVLETLIEAMGTSRASTVGVVEIPPEDSRLYGIVDIGGNQLAGLPAEVHSTVEKPLPENAPSQYAIIGRYVFLPTLFDALKSTEPGVGGEIQLTDAMNRLAQSRQLFALRVSARRYDMGNPYYFVKAQLDAALMRPDLSAAIRQYLVSLCG